MNRSGYLAVDYVLVDIPRVTRRESDALLEMTKDGRRFTLRRRDFRKKEVTICPAPFIVVVGPVVHHDVT